MEQTSSDTNTSTVGMSGGASDVVSDSSNPNVTDDLLDGISLIIEKRIFELYQKQAVQGDLQSIWNLANCYRMGAGVDKDEKQAVKLYQKAADQGHLDSMFNLGFCYEKGIGVAKDEKQAV
jgi:Sel1 repeat